MKYLKQFESFSMAQPQESPSTQPSQPTIKPGVKPRVKPSRKSPIRRHKPAVDPKPKAELDDVLDLLNLTASDEDKKEIVNHYAKN